MSYSVIPDYTYDVKTISKWKVLPEDDESGPVGGRYRSRFVAFLERNIKADKKKVGGTGGRVTDGKFNVPRFPAKAVVDSGRTRKVGMAGNNGRPANVVEGGDGSDAKPPAINWNPVKVPVGSRIPVAIAPKICRLSAKVAPVGCNDRTIPGRLKTNDVACGDDDVHAIGCQDVWPAARPWSPPSTSSSLSLSLCGKYDSADVRDRGDDNGAADDRGDRTMCPDAAATDDFFGRVSSSVDDVQKWQSTIESCIFDKRYGYEKYEKSDYCGANRTANDSTGECGAATVKLREPPVRTAATSAVARKQEAHEKQIVDAYGQKIVRPSVVTGKHRASSSINRKTVNRETERVNNIMRKKLLTVKSTLRTFR